MRTLTGMVLGCLMINLVIATAGYLAVRFSWLLANLTAIVLAVAMVFLAFWFQQGSWAWAALIALVAAVLAGMYLREIQDLQGRPILGDLALADAVRHPEAAGFHFREGVVRTDLSGFYDTAEEGPAEGASTVHEVAPVVFDGWSATDPVDVWAVSWNMPDPAKEWRQPHRAGLRIGATFRDDYVKAVRDAERRHGLTSHPEMALVRWVASPEKAREDYWREVWLVVKVWNIVYGAGLLLYWAYRWLQPWWAGKTGS